MSVIPFGHHTATLLRRERREDAQGRPQERWRALTLVGCSLFYALCDRESQENVTARPAARCHIPANQPAPKTGDALLPGIGTAGEMLTAAQAVARVAETPGGFFIARVEDRTGPGWPLPHWVAEGEWVSR